MIPTIGSTSLRTFQPRHSIVDLSAAAAASSQESSSFLLSGTVGASPRGRRVVASKRRPVSFGRTNNHCPGSNASNRYDQSKDSDKKLSEKLELRTHGSASLDSDTSSSYPVSLSFRLLLKEFSHRHCAIYEPVVTYRAFSQFHPIFQTCVNYLKQHFNNKQDVPSTAAATESFGNADSGCPTTLNRNALVLENFLKLQVLNSQYMDNLKKLEFFDLQVMRTVRLIEIEHDKLYSFQSRWALTCASEQTKNVAVNNDKLTIERTTESHYKVLPWETPMLKRLEQLDLTKEGLKALFQSATSVCNDLDSLMESGISSVVSLMKLLGFEAKKHDIRWMVLKKPKESEEGKEDCHEDEAATEESISVKQEFFSPVLYNDVLAIKKKKETPLLQDSSVSTTDFSSIAQNVEDFPERDGDEVRNQADQKPMLSTLQSSCHHRYADCDAVCLKTLI